MYEKIIIAGSGGQGIMFLGSIIAKCALAGGKFTTFYPSYGAEMRGGTASCSVIISDTEIGSPMINNPSILIILNEQSYNKFSPKLKPGGRMFLNSSLINDAESAGIPVPATETATELGDVRAANLVMLGKFVSVTKLFPAETVNRVIRDCFSAKKGLLDINLNAFLKGTEL